MSLFGKFDAFGNTLDPCRHLLRMAVDSFILVANLAVDEMTVSPLHADGSP